MLVVRRELCFIYFTGFLLAPIYGSVSLNLKSSFLSHLLGSQKTHAAPAADSDSHAPDSNCDESAPTPKTAIKALDSDVLKVDLSGDVYFYLWGKPPSLVDDGDVDDDSLATTPLFSTNLTQKAPPIFLPRSTIGGIHYDFQKSSFGISRIMACFRWKPPRVVNPANGSPKSNLLNKVYPDVLDATIESEFCDNRAFELPKYRLDLYYRMKPLGIRKTQEPMSTHLKTSTQMTSSGKFESHSLRIPCHPQNRITWTGKVVTERDALPPASNLRDSNEWIPNISVDTSGNLQSVQQIWVNPQEQLPSLFAHRDKNRKSAVASDGRWGIQLRFQRRFASWLTPLDEDESPTVLQLKLSHLTPRFRSEANFKAHLEHPLQSLRLDLEQTTIVEETQLES